MRGRLPRRHSDDYFAQKVLPRLFEPSRDELTVEPVVASQVLLSLTMYGGNFRKPLRAQEIVTLTLDGVRNHGRAARTARTATRGRPATGSARTG